MSKTMDRNGGSGMKMEKGGFLLGMIVGVLLGLAGALIVALYITKTPVPFLNKVPQRTAEQDAAEAERNKDWDPNALLAGKPVSKAASGVIGAPKPAPAATPLPALPKAAPASAAASGAGRADKAVAVPAAASAAAGVDPFVYFVQVGAFNKSDDAEAQHAKVAMLGFAAKVYEFEQSGRTVYRVRVGPFDKKDDADAQQKKIEAAGVAVHMVRMER